jgi:two-component system LytT family response regulator
MNKCRVVIADDERPAREYLKSLLNGIAEAELVGEAENGADAVEMIKKLRPDLALLDLEMPEMTGLEAARALTGANMPVVAFVTAYDEYAVRAFELNAVDYLLKPVEQARLRETIARAAERLERMDWRETESSRIAQAADSYSASGAPDLLEWIPVKEREEILLLPVGDIVSIIADGELLKITAADRRRFTINHRLKDLEARLDEGKFVRLSRSAIVNLEYVASAAPMPGGTYLIKMRNGQEIPSSRMQSRQLRANLLRL